jgi:uncharacterized protein YcbK (DUF882 family)
MLLEELIEIRGEFNSPLIITSGARCKVHNKAVGGSSNSQHLFGRAADFYMPDVNINILADFILRHYPDLYGIGVYPNRIHLDTRSEKARWLVSE